MAWFKKTRKPIKSNEKASRVPEGLWVKCPSCGRAIYNKELGENQQVCTKCGHHFRMSATERLKLLFDGGVDRARRGDCGRSTRCKFTDTKPTRRGSRPASRPPGLNDAVIVATGTLDGVPVVIASMEYSFIGGSMGVVVGEKITRGAEIALQSRAALHHRLLLGGARMMEGALVADADGEDQRSLGTARPCRLAVSVDSDGSDHGRAWTASFRDARRSQHCGAERR
jgi:acetyl-CoA carboxylase carboxyl transferase subunit beta